MTGEIKRSARSMIIAFISAGIAFAVMDKIVTSSDGPEPQDLGSLDRRISSVEQKLYSIESSIRRLEGQAIHSSRTTPSQPARDPEVDRLRNDVERLRGRMKEVECGLVHLDERTLSPTVKRMRGAGGQTKDPCRTNSDAPVQLSTHR